MMDTVASMKVELRRRQSELREELARVCGELELTSACLEHVERYSECRSSLGLQADGARVEVDEREFARASMREAAAEVLRRAGRPLRAEQILTTILRGGYPHVSRSSLQSVTTCCNRNPEFKNVGRNTFALVPAEEEGVLQPAGQGRYR